MNNLFGNLLRISIFSLFLVACHSNKLKENNKEAANIGIYEGVFIDINDTIISDNIDPNVTIETHLLKNLSLTKREDFWGAKNNFHLHAMGSINVPESNYYYFKLVSSGSVLFKLNNKDLFIKNQRIRKKETDSAKTYLEKGYTIFEFEYFPGYQDSYLELEWSKDGKQFEVIPDSIIGNLDAFSVKDWIAPDESESVMVPDNTLTEAEKKDGWKLLFDGKTMNGWHTYNKPGTIGSKWKAENNMLLFEGRKRFEFYVAGRKIELGPVNKVLDGGEDIVTDDAFENFELHLEWKISEAGNNGIFFTVQENKKYKENWNTSPEMQVMDNQKHKDGLINKHRAGDLYDLIATDTIRVKPYGKWNKVRIIKNNGKVEQWLNGYKVVSYDLKSKEWKDLISKSKFADLPDFANPGLGKIGFQDHDNVVYYKNIKIKVLK